MKRFVVEFEWSVLKCILLIFTSELSGTLQETLEQAEEAMDVALSRLCTNFNAESYSKLQAAYALLGKTQVRFIDPSFL